MNGNERALLRNRVNIARRARVAPDVCWIPCPVHNLPVGLAIDGTVLGRCSECAGEAARGIAAIARGAA
jgi:hypothetical protein